MLYKRLINFCLLALIAVMATAQSGTNSPYTRYGFGQLSDQSFGNSKAMGGIAYGLRNGFQINASNPASYSAVDSLTFLFDAGLSLQNANFKEGTIKTNAKNSTIDYIAMQFRLMENLGFAAGFLPYSIVGYEMNQTSVVPNSQDEYGEKTYKTTKYSGDGGLQQVFLGLGYQMFDNKLSIGANMSYLYGDISHTVSTAFSNANAFKSVWTEKISVKDYKLDLGAQYTQRFGKKHALTLGAVYSFGHNLNSDCYRYNEKYDSNNVLQTQTKDSISNACDLPTTFGVGLTYVYNNRLTIGVDYTMQKWADAKFPATGEHNKYEIKEGMFTNRTKIAVGAEFMPNPFSRKYLSRVRYRIGAYYSNPYAKVDGKEGTREYGASFGLGLPLFQSRSILNISGQYVHVSPKVKGMLEEQYLRINIGLTFNERWFMKWKVD